MSRLKFRLPSPALVIAIAAMFVALGSVSYAATQIKKNSVGTKQLKKSAVNSSKVKNKSLKAVDFKPGQLPSGEKGATGPQGPKGDPGQNGAAGTAGAPGISGWETVHEYVPNSSAVTKSGYAVCPSGKTVLGGGATITGIFGVHDGEILFDEMRPISNNLFYAKTQTISQAPIYHGVDIHAICANVAP